MPIGRPTKYNKAIQEKADEYVESTFSTVPNSAGLAVHLSVSRSTIYKWASENPVFSDTLERLQEKQQTLLIEKGLSNDFNSTITKLMLANHGFHDKVDSVNVDMTHEQWLSSLDE